MKFIPINSLIPSSVKSFMRSAILSCSYSLIVLHPFSRTFVSLQSFLDSSTHPLTHSSIRRFIRSAVHAFMYLSIHGFICMQESRFTNHLLLMMLLLLKRVRRGSFTSVFACVTLRLSQSLPWWMSFWECRSLELTWLVSRARCFTGDNWRSTLVAKFWQRS